MFHTECGAFGIAYIVLTCRSVALWLVVAQQCFILRRASLPARAYERQRRHRTSPCGIGRHRKAGRFHQLDELAIGVGAMRATTHLDTTIGDERVLDVESAARGIVFIRHQEMNVPGSEPGPI